MLGESGLHDRTTENLCRVLRMRDERRIIETDTLVEKTETGWDLTGHIANRRTDVEVVERVLRLVERHH